MAGPVKTVCFIASVVIACGFFEVGEAIIAWFDYKINGTEIPYFGPMKGLFQAIRIIIIMISIVFHGLLLHGILKENPNAMVPWMFLYYFFMLVGLCVILTSMMPFSSYPPIVSTSDYVFWFSSVYLKICLSKIPNVRAAHKVVLQIPNIFYQSNCSSENKNQWTSKTCKTCPDSFKSCTNSQLCSQLVKFIHSEKATKFCEIFTLLLTGTT